MNLINVGQNAKTIKSDKLGEYLTGILYLAPAKISGHNVCASSSQGCRKACLFSAGYGALPSVRDARVNKTKLFTKNPAGFEKLLYDDIFSLCSKCEKLNVKPAIRLNGTSDIPWENKFPSIFTNFNQVQFYDYTKSFVRMQKFLKGDLPKNYHLTYSRRERDEERCIQVLKQKGNVAIVFFNIPKKWKGYPVHSGDEHDLRFLDPFGVCSLKPKGKAKYDSTGFVI